MGKNTTLHNFVLFLSSTIDTSVESITHESDRAARMTRVHDESGENKTPAIKKYHFKYECEGFIRFPNPRKHLKPRGLRPRGFIVFERLET